MSTPCLATNSSKRSAAVEANDKLTELNKSKRPRLSGKKGNPSIANHSNAGLNRSVRANAVNISLISTNEVQAQDNTTEAEEIGYEDRLLGKRKQ